MFAPVLLSLISTSNRAIAFSLGIRRRRAQRMIGRPLSSAGPALQLLTVVHRCMVSIVGVLANVFFFRIKTHGGDSMRSSCGPVSGAMHARPYFIPLVNHPRALSAELRCELASSPPGWRGSRSICWLCCNCCHSRPPWWSVMSQAWRPVASQAMFGAPPSSGWDRQPRRRSSSRSRSEVSLQAEWSSTCSSMMCPGHARTSARSAPARKAWESQAARHSHLNHPTRHTQPTRNHRSRPPRMPARFHTRQDRPAAAPEGLQVPQDHPAVHVPGWRHHQRRRHRWRVHLRPRL